MSDNEKKVFGITPAGKQTYIFLVVLIVVTLIGPVSMLYSYVHKNVPLSPTVVCIIIVVFVDALMIWFGYSARNIKYVIDKDSISIKNTLYGRTIKKSSVFAKGFTITDLNTQSTYRPGLRTNGVGLPGYMAGWFRLKNKQKGLLFVTDRSKVVCIPTQKYMLLISVENPVEFLQAIKEMWNIE
jgi:hypothetical protein